MSNPCLDNFPPDGVTPYKYILEYLDHFTKRFNLALMKRKCAEEITEVLLNISCDAGPPHILHSEIDDILRMKYCSQLFHRNSYSELIHSKPRHPESQQCMTTRTISVG